MAIVLVSVLNVLNIYVFQALDVQAVVNDYLVHNLKKSSTVSG